MRATLPTPGRQFAAAHQRPLVAVPHSRWWGNPHCSAILGAVSYADPQTIRELLTTTETWAVVGCSPDPARDSHRIAALLQRHGFRVIPINPAVEQILGERCYPSLTDLADPPDVVDIFRRAEQAGTHVDEAITVGAKAVWMQLGVIDLDAAARASAAGLKVVMDRCPAIELPRLAPA